MKTQFVTISVLAAALLSATAFADTAPQMNQMGQTQTTTTTPSMPSTTTTTTQPGMPSTANPQAMAPNQTVVTPVPQTGAMPDAATGSPDEMNTPTPPTPSNSNNNY